MQPRVAKLRSALARAHQSPHPDQARIADLREQLAEEMAAQRAAELRAEVAHLSEPARIRVASILRPLLTSLSDVDRREAVAA